MDENNKQIGTFAGKIWNMLNESGPLNQKEIIENIKLENFEFYLGIGWLIKENKINKSKQNGMYQLGDSNLTEEIEKNAELIKNKFKNQSKKNVAEISKSTELRPREVYTALGWIAREGNLDIFDDKTLQKKYSIKE